ncbi:hypothetical protein GDO86_014966 [Hymenochirus boettgeri]|uniref:Uncharacterized protein n=1 Tax=Hymenochirus boettgeri TaxID=247094 RepID=A0A8T2JZ86_9PIPI|nr:hypothetical protein GDO86_014966 [Hymenochirus boettgeri]
MYSFNIPARELSIQRQKIKESHRLCVVCCKNFINILKAFDELLQASDVDYFVADAFRAHLDQSLKYIKQLESKLCHDDPSSLAQITDDEEAVGCDANSEKRSKYNGCLQRTESPDHRTPETEIAETPETEIAETICSSSSHQNQGSMERESQGLTPVTFAEDDAYSDHSPDKSYKTLRLVPGHHMWADNCGNYVLGLVEDFNALDKQILEGRSVVQEMEGYLGHIVYSAGAKVTDDFEIFFYEKLRRTQQSLEEASHLMKLLWRVSLPKHFTNSFSICQDEDHGKETFSARHKDWEERFSGMEKPENQTSGEIEKLILDQLALTHKVLKKARGNLEMQVYKRIL